MGYIIIFLEVGTAVPSSVAATAAVVWSRAPVVAEMASSSMPSPLALPTRPMFPLPLGLRVMKLIL